MAEYWHRITSTRTAPPLDEYDNPIGRGTVHAYCNNYAVIKHTPKGVWLNLHCGDKRFILKSAKKRFACPTVEEAFISFEARTKRRVNILSSQISDCLEGIEDAKRNMNLWKDRVKS